MDRWSGGFTRSGGVFHSSSPLDWLPYWTPSVGQSHLSLPSAARHWSLSCFLALSCNTHTHTQIKILIIPLVFHWGHLFQFFHVLEEPVRVPIVRSLILGDGQTAESWQGPLHSCQVLTFNNKPQTLYKKSYSYLVFFVKKKKKKM